MGPGKTKASPATRLLRGHRRAVRRLHARGSPRQAEAPARLRADLRAGAIGIGEQKSAVAIDGPEMRMVYDIAAEHRVPVLLHIGGEGDNSGYERFPAILKRYASVIFIGHATGFPGHISADYDGTTGYPTGSVKPGGLTDRWLVEYPNLYGDLSARSRASAPSPATPPSRGGSCGDTAASSCGGRTVPARTGRAPGSRGGSAKGRSRSGRSRGCSATGGCIRM